jgi:hypothetical protein
MELQSEYQPLLNLPPAGNHEDMRMGQPLDISSGDGGTKRGLQERQ